MAYMVGLLALMLLYTSGTLTTSAQYTVTPQSALSGWSYQLVNINRLQCLLACSRKIYCLSVNYNNHERLCQINRRHQEDESTGNLKEDSSFDYIEKILDTDFRSHGVHLSSSDVTYEEAYDICNDNLGTLASYEHLYTAFQPHLDNCTEGWLIGGEVAFTEISNKCTLKSPNQRSNVFPCKSYHSGYYCYRKYNNHFDDDYIPANQRIIRLTGTNANKLNRTDSEECCSLCFGGRLATPFEVYNAWYSMGVGLCEFSWYLSGMAGYVCYTEPPSEFWLYPVGNYIRLRDPNREYFGMCYLPLPNQTLTFPDPFPPHRVINVEGVARYTLTYQEARTRCIEHGGALATRAQVEDAYNAGYDCCNWGWTEGGEVLYPITHPRAGCGNVPTGIHSDGRTNPLETFNGYCYIP